jgi:aminoglycoside phosphotransferase (APT) family kinase protein
MDWERFCQGHPAIDLAITMPGIGSKDGAMERTMAEMYIRLWQKNTGSVPTELDALERGNRVAKLWEFIANAKVAPALYPHDTVAYIVRELPSLFDQLL